MYNRLRRQNIDTIKVFASHMKIDLRDEQDAIERGEREVRRRLALDVVDSDGEVIAEVGQALTDTVIKKIRKAEITKVSVFVASGRAESTLIKNTLAKDPTHSEKESLSQIYALLRPGDAPDAQTAKQALERLFFSPKRYDLGRVGRYKINQRLGMNMPADYTVLSKEDFVEIIRYLVELHEGRGHVDDIDHLGNRRIRSVGELIANQFSVGLSRMARLVKERMSINTDPEKISLDDLVNARTVSAVIQAFFGSSQLSQFMDQTNPLAELTHKRRLSALGPGGLTRERAGFEVRDVHYSQYGRMCPIETPEGPNIGLITSLACYAQVNDLGFVETPYLVVKNGKVLDEIAWLDANKEEDAIIAQANSRVDANGDFLDDLVLARQQGDVPLVPKDRIDYMDVAPEQLVSIAAALIPFLEHDDANRALMGSNMQRQAVPLLNPRTPLVGTGLEEQGGRRLGRRRHRQARWRRVARDGRRDHRRRRPGRGEEGSAGRRRSSARASHAARPLSPQEVLENEPGHGDQPASARSSGPEGQAGRRAGRRRGDRAGSARARLERDRGVHAVVRTQFRRCHRALRALGEGRRLFVDPHPGARAARPRHEARSGRDHA